MKRNVNRQVIRAGMLFLSFVLFTALVAWFDVQPIGPEETSVGFASVNRYVFQQLGVHWFWYRVTEWIGIAAILIAAGFGAVGLGQLIRSKRIGAVDRSILALGAVYALAIAFYLLFEEVVINFRPVILDGELEASYPSSHVMVIVCIMATAALQVRALWSDRRELCRWVDAAAGVLVVLTVVGRLVSGVHWFTDIVGGLLLSAALTALYCALAQSG